MAWLHRGWPCPALPLPKYRSHAGRRGACDLLGCSLFTHSPPWDYWHSCASKRAEPVYTRPDYRRCHVPTEAATGGAEEASPRRMAIWHSRQIPGRHRRDVIRPTGVDPGRIYRDRERHGVRFHWSDTALTMDTSNDRRRPPAFLEHTARACGASRISRAPWTPTWSTEEPLAEGGCLLHLLQMRRQTLTAERADAWYT